MQDNNLESKQAARFIVSACKQDVNIKPQIVKPILEFNRSSELIVRDFILADLNLLQQNLSMTDIIALNWFVRINDARVCHFEHFIKELSSQGQRSIHEVKQWLVSQAISPFQTRYQALKPVLASSTESIYNAEEIIRSCLRDPTTKTIAISPYFELDSRSNLVLQGFTQANHYHYDKSMSTQDIYTLNWFITTDFNKICYFQDFINLANKYKFKFNIMHLKA